MNNIFPIFDKVISQHEKEKLINQRSLSIWLVGLSGSGKSTLAKELEAALHEEGILTQLLDGDNLRFGLNKDLSFSDGDRKENVRRAAEVARIFSSCGVVTITSMICPTEEIRQMVREIIGGDYYEVFVNCPIEECEKRDVKGLYQKARNGELKNFTGIDSRFEIPLAPDLVLKTDVYDIVECRKMLFDLAMLRIKYNPFI